MLTRKAEVLAVLEAGGSVDVQVRANSGSVGYGLAYLFNAAGVPVPAWQQAIKSNLSKCQPGLAFRTPYASPMRRWKLQS
jgi:hypothetical protein